MLTVPKVIEGLTTHTERFPWKAMRAALAQRDAVIPELLKALEAVANNPAEYALRQDYMLHLFAMYLLAQFREKRAYAPIVKMFSTSGETPFELAEDVVCDGLTNILASVYDGDPAPLQSLVEGEAVNEFVRSAALGTFTTLFHSGQMSRDQVVEYWRSLFHGRLERKPAMPWATLVSEAANLPAPELLEEIRQAFADGLVFPDYCSLADIESDLANPKPGRFDRYALIEDAIDEMEWWDAFHPQRDWAEKTPTQSPPEPEPELWPVDDSILPDPPSDGTRMPWAEKPGRNDPCYCGSGKKYKKCCGKP